MADTYDTFADALDTPAVKAFAITPSATGELTSVTRGIYVGTAGNINMILADDTSAVSFVGAAAGTVIPVRAKQVLVTGTTATDLVGLY